MSFETAVFFVRLLALGCAIVHLGILLGNIAQTYDRFNANQLPHYLRQQIVRPTIGLLIATVIWLAAAPLALWLTAASAH